MIPVGEDEASVHATVCFPLDCTGFPGSSLTFLALVALASYARCFRRRQWPASPHCRASRLPRAAAHRSRCIVRTTEPFSVPGEWGAILGEQGGGGSSGGFEAWIWPVKVISGLHIIAELADYPVRLLDVNAQPGIIRRWTRSHATITYSPRLQFTVPATAHLFGHAATIRLRGTGPVILFEFSSIRPLDLTLQFTPVVEQMWPAPELRQPQRRMGHARRQRLLHPAHRQ